MQHKFHVTGLGIQIDGRMVMPGSTLHLKAQPPSHWQRFGEYTTQPGEAPKQEFEVATPSEEQPKRRGRPRKAESTEVNSDD